MLLHGISKLIFAEKTGNTYGTATIIDGVDVEDNAIATWALTVTQNKTTVGAGMVANAHQLRSPQTGIGTATFVNLSRENMIKLLDATANGNGGISAGSMFGKRKKYGVTIIQEDGDLIVGKTFYDVEFGVPTDVNKNSVSVEAPESLPIVLPIEVHTVMVRLSNGKLKDYFSTDFNSVDDAANITTLTTTIALPTESSVESL